MKTILLQFVHKIENKKKTKTKAGKMSRTKYILFFILHILWKFCSNQSTNNFFFLSKKCEGSLNCIPSFKEYFIYAIQAWNYSSPFRTASYPACTLENRHFNQGMAIGCLYTADFDSSICLLMACFDFSELCRPTRTPIPTQSHLVEISTNIYLIY